MGFMDIIDALNAVLWGTPLIVLLLGTGILLTVGSGFFQFVHFGHIMKCTFGSLTKSNNKDGEGSISAFEAASIAVGGAVGAGNISGVATAVAVGGPGSIFWIWLIALIGMITKCAEVTLALHYRTKDVTGERYVGGPTYYMQEGLGVEKHWGGAYKILAIIFSVGIFISFVFTMQNYSTSESISSTFPQFSMPMVATVFAILLTIVVAGGLKRVGEFASKAVPIMCIMYMVFALIIIVKNIGALPGVIGMIFKHAFTPTAASGGFAGATVGLTITKGIQRALYSNEAGWGTSPMVHATSIVDHPIQQGMWGCFEVFVDTILVCSMTALVLLTSGIWDSGLTSATLTLTAFEQNIGFLGRAVIALSVFLFAFTTGTGWYTYYDTLIRHGFKNDSSIRRAFLAMIKYGNAIPGWACVMLSTKYDVGASSVWGIVDVGTAVPTFCNLIALIILSKRFFELLKDYKARYMGIGEVDPEFKIWYEDRKAAAK
ncbi:MAG: sodium:alanine symporter family protein [Clostridia bacterium]|nr:sodium:alanine symporter family protein [Clostridia bacterium]